MKFLITAALSALILSLSYSVKAAKTASASVSPDGITIHTKAVSKGSLKVSGPQDFYKEFELSGGIQSVNFSELGLAVDGVYSFQYVGFSAHGRENVKNSGNGRVNATKQLGVANKVSGHFTVENGYIVQPNSREEG